MGSKRDNAISLYLEGIRDGNIDEAIAKYTGARYTQHSTGVGDGQEGFIAFFKEFVVRNPERDIQVIRALEDGQYVFVHAYQSLNGGAAEWVTTDIFDTDDDNKMIEHWDVITPYCAKTASGRSNIDGEREVRDHDRTDENKRIVRTLIEQVLIPGGTPAQLSEVVVDNLIQHDPDLPDGREAFAVHVAGEGRALKYSDLVLLVGEGNFVATLCRTYLRGKELAQVDLFRLDGGKIVERWLSAEPVAPKEEWGNSGKF